MNIEFYKISYNDNKWNWKSNWCDGNAHIIWHIRFSIKAVNVNRILQECKKGTGRSSFLEAERKWENLTRKMVYDILMFGALVYTECIFTWFCAVKMVWMRHLFTVRSFKMVVNIWERWKKEEEHQFEWGREKKNEIHITHSELKATSYTSIEILIVYS